MCNACLIENVKHGMLSRRRLSPGRRDRRQRRRHGHAERAPALRRRRARCWT